MFRSRREFVKLASVGAAGAIWPLRAIAQLDIRRAIPEALGISRTGTLDPAELAATAIDAARRAGASFADVRIDHHLSQSASVVDTFGGYVGLSDTVGAGIRVIVDGQWGFVASETLSADAIADAARRAVQQARVNAKARKSPVELVPTPVVSDGRWATPTKVDPFTVPIGEQQEALLSGTTSARAVNGIAEARAGMSFVRVHRVFASTEGSRITQTFVLAFPNAAVSGTVATDAVMASASPDGFTWQAAGYEVMVDAGLAETMRAAAHRALRDSRERLRNPSGAPRSVDVGRYELVVDPSVFYGLVSGTILQAVGMERALGKLAGREGTSYASPPDQAIGTMHLASPLLTVSGDRSWALNGLMACGWDDEGVKPDTLTLVDRGVLTDYLALREHVPIVGARHRAGGTPSRAHGVAATGSWSRPSEVTPNIAIAPGREPLTVDDMIKDVKHGIYLSAGGGAEGDFALLNAYGGAGRAQQIRNGKLVGELRDVAIQFSVRPFWQGLLAVGGPASVTTFADGGASLFACRTVRSVPAWFKEVNVVNTGRTQ